MRVRLLLVVGLLALLAVGGSVAQARTHRGHHRAHHHHRGHAHHRAHRHHRHHGTAHQTVKLPVAQPRPAPSPAPAPVPVVLPPPLPLPAPPSLSHLQVPEREFTLSLSRPVLPVGRVVIEAVDFGEDPHNLQIERVGSSEAPVSFPIIGPGARTWQTVDLQAGTYRLYCSLGDHDALGMHATLTVR